MRHRSGIFGSILLTLPLATLGPDIVIRHDRPDSAYLELGARYADVLAHVEDRAEGTIVAPRWVLTAGHVAEPIGPFDVPFVTIRGERYGVEKILIHPNWEESWDRARGGPRELLSSRDLALLKLDRPVQNVRPVVPYRGRDEQGMALTILGRGKTGTGATGAVGGKGTVVRGATNRVSGATETALLTIFDVDGDATELEGAGAAGDSGGPALVERGDTLYVVGVSSAGTGMSGYAMYGTLDIYTRVSSFADWIDSTIAADPPPTVDWSPPVRLDPAVTRFPETPAGRLAHDFFATFAASIDEEGLEEWVRFYQRRGSPDADTPSLERRASALRQGLVEPLGPVEIHGYAAAGSHMIQVLVRSRGSDWRAIGLDTDPEQPDRMARLYMKWESAPEPELWRR